MTKEPFISVVIPAHNEEKYIVKTLDHLRRQNYSNFEIIVVANGCTDKTAKVSAKKCDKLVITSVANHSNARNIGAKKSKGKILVFLDADTLLEKNALASISQEFLKKHSTGTLKAKPDTNLFSHKFLYYLKNFFHWSRIHYGSSGVILSRKTVFKKVKFDTSLHYKENSDFIKRSLKYGKYKYIGSAIATTSMRRFEKKGYWKLFGFWLKTFFFSMFKDIRGKEYEVVR